MIAPRRSLETAISLYGPAARARLAPALAAADFVEGPQALRLIALKEERSLELWGAGEGWRAIHRYPILGASGGPGPKLMEGDHQVPEGRYPLVLLNPNSRFHLSIRVGYPSSEDEAQAALDERSDLGGDIMIHGGNGSVGCLAIGDLAIEELFVLVASVGLDRSEILIAPLDLRHREASDPRPWVQARYRALADEMQAMPRCAWPVERGE